ncbi:hypothetical protein HB364_13565 [Pseudoflavitalea sp. X16]|uniref:hypothetical protein n=1 Tax=Paraflavitalea devenefica TaxID=2716334 RepID=UPI00142352E5|nr:hypothetical protein [Paraflavitalea devenefica]NII26117.1 hypothetical protein [Paraflavitalea devenefica]
MFLTLPRMYELAQKLIIEGLSLKEIAELETIIAGSEEMPELFFQFMTDEADRLGLYTMDDMELEAEWLIFSTNLNWSKD